MLYFFPIDFAGMKGVGADANSFNLFAAVVIILAWVFRLRVRTKSNLGASSASSALSVEQASIDVAEVDDPNPPATLAIPTIAVTPPTVSPEAHLGQESSPPLNAAAADHIDQSSDGHNFPLHLDILITNKRGWIKTVHLDEYTEALEGLAWNEMVLLTEVELIEKGVVSVEARRELIKYFNAIINALEIDAEHSTGKNHQLLRELFAPNFGTNPGTDNPGPRSASSRKRARKRARQAASREGTST